MKKFAFASIGVILTFGLVVFLFTAMPAAADPTPTPTPTCPAITPTPTPTLTSTPTPTPTWTSTPTPTLTATPSPTPTPTPTGTVVIEYNIYKGNITLVLSNAAGTELNIYTEPIDSGVVNISFAENVVNNTRTFVLDAASLNITPVFFPDPLGMGMDFNLTLALDENAVGTLYVVDNVGDVDVFSLTTKGGSPQTNTTIGDGNLDTGGSVLLPAALNGTADVYLNESVYPGDGYFTTIILPMAANMTTNKSGNEMYDEDPTVYNGSQLNLSGVAFDQNGGLYDYVGTNGVLVTTLGAYDVWLPQLGGYITFQAGIEWWLCSGTLCPTPTPTPSPTPTPTPTATPSPTPSPTEPPGPGDVNGDYVINCLDITQVELCILFPETYPKEDYPGWDADENGEGPNSGDIMAVVLRILEQWPP